MKKIFEISFVYIGLVIGAGFASGREIMEYFNNSSHTDPSGIILASFLFTIISYIIMHHSNRFGAENFDAFIDCTSGRLAPAIKAFMLLYMFCGLFVMMSGSGALFHSALNIPRGYGIFALAILCFIIFSFDIKGLIAVNTVMVPIMIIGLTALCISSALSDTAPVFSLFDDRLRRNPLLSAICYASYNTVTAGAVLVPLARHTDKKTLAKSAAISSSVLGFLIFTVWLVQSIYYNNIYNSEMPLFELAIKQGKIWETAYTAILFMALCTTAVSHGFGILSKFTFKTKTDRCLAAALLCALAIPFAKIGFSDLVAYLYSAFGVLGLLWLGIVLFSYFRNSN